jgi:hypothetical protein
MVRRAALALLLSGLASATSVAQCVNVSVPMGSGCGFSTPFGIPVVSCTGAPSIGNASFGFTTSTPCPGVPTAGALLVGTCLPSPIQFLDGPSTGLCISQAVCALWVSPIVFLTGLPQAGGFAFPTPIPNDPQLVGLQLCVQGAHTCSGLSCLSATNAVGVTLF